jgi:hypothetical protein
MSENGDTRDLAAELIEQRRADQSLEQRLLANPALMAAISESRDHPERLVRRTRATRPLEPVPDLVEEIAHMVEFQPLMSDLTLDMGDLPYHKELANKIRRRFVSESSVLARARIEADTGLLAINDILEAMCENQNISTVSPYDPNKRAPNFILAQRLGIGRVFNIPDGDPE